jgi:hypothetical protein
MVFLTLKQLRKMEACDPALKFFKHIFGTKASIKKVVELLHNPPEDYIISESKRKEWEGWLLGQTPKLTQALLKAGADVYACDNRALRWAAENGHTEIVKLLLKSEADVHAMDDYALRRAAENGHTKIVKLLLKAGANVHARADYALRWAVMYDHTEVVKILKEAMK